MIRARSLRIKWAFSTVGARKLLPLLLTHALLQGARCVCRWHIVVTFFFLLQYIETSALNATNVDEAFMTLARAIKAKGTAGLQRANILRPTEEKTSGGGCCG